MEKIYAIENPFWMSDTFIFTKKTYKSRSFYVYIKINSKNRIEEIGHNLPIRYNEVDINKIIIKSVKPTKLQRSIFNRIGDEYWSGMIKDHFKKSTCKYDKNGVEIFEGDIISCPFGSNVDHNAYVCLVKYLGDGTFYPFNLKKENCGFNTDPKFCEIDTIHGLK